MKATVRHYRKCIASTLHRSVSFVASLNRALLVIICVCLSFGPGRQIQGQEDEPSEWTIKSAQGTKKLKARVTSIVKGAALLTDANNKTYTVPLSSLPEDQRKEALIRVIGSGVVAVHTKTVLDQPLGAGSGFVMFRDGYILTNYHVIRGAGAIEVEFRDHKEKVPANCLAVDRDSDVAVLKVKQLPEGVHVLELAVQSLPKQGDSVWTIGHPRGLNNTVSWGDVNAVRKTAALPAELKAILTARSDTAWIQTDAVISHGSSGGPLLNPQGQALGMNTFALGPQLGFAVYLLQARDTFNRARAQAEPLTLPLPPSEKESAFAWISRDVAPLIKSYAEEAKALEAGSNKADQQQALEKLLAVNDKYRPQFLALARKDPASWPAFQAIYYACDLPGKGEVARQQLAEACELLLDHHTKSRDLGAIVNQLAGVEDDRIEDFFLQTLETSPHREVQAQAAIALAFRRVNWLTESGGMDVERTKAVREGIERIALRLEKELGDVTVGKYQGKQYAEEFKSQLVATRVGTAALEIAGVDNEGKSFKLSDYKGKVIVLDFFAHWCPWCRKMYPDEQKLVEQYKDRPFVLLGVNCDNQKILGDIVNDKTVTWRSWADGERGPIATSWNVDGYPTVYLIDHQGIVRKRLAGVLLEDEFRAAIDTLTKEAERDIAK